MHLKKDERKKEKVSRGREATGENLIFYFLVFFPALDLLLLASLDSLSTPVSFSLLSKTADDNRVVQNEYRNAPCFSYFTQGFSKDN